MEVTSSNEILKSIIVVSSVMFFIVGIIIIYVILSQRRHAKQQQKMHDMKAAHQKDLFKSMVKAQESERQKIAKNLHDEIGPSLSAGKYLIGHIQPKVEGEMLDNVIKVKEILESTYSEIRRVIDDLSPNSLFQFGLFAELINLSDLSKAIGNVTLRVEADDKTERYGADIELTLYRIIKEFMNNTLKYAHAKNIYIVFAKIDGKLTIDIQDDGDGFDFNPNDNKGHGIKNMESRVFLLNGESVYKSTIGVGTELKITIPLPNSNNNLKS